MRSLTVATQWHKRKISGNRPNLRNRGILFDLEHPRADIHKSIYNSWLRAISALHPELALISRIKEGRLVIRKLRG